mmetsp:Transcript_31740/g.80555  ORF Transcript_31740/g.80555 Transcript_31740/m.80555 type:complete len:412 (+) Transcript_31740:126-1361(+)
MLISARTKACEPSASQRRGAVCRLRLAVLRSSTFFAVAFRVCIVAAQNPVCWSPDYGYTAEVCCPPDLEPVGNITCWWDGFQAGDFIATGDYSYAGCCNRTNWARTEAVLGDLMARATKMPYLYAERIVMELDHAGLLPSRFVVNYGAADGSASGDDPAVPLFKEHGFPGLAVEPDEARAAKLRRSMPAAVQVREVGVTPLNTADLLREASAPEEPALLKVDIDSFDCPVLLATLRVSRPAVVQVEVNSEVPYPVIFGVHYSPNFRHSDRKGREHGWFSRGFFGCSSTLAAELAQPFGYDVVGQAGAHDVLLMRRDLRLAMNKGMPWAPLRAYTAAGVARAISVRCMKKYFGSGVGVSWLMLAETRPEILLKFVTRGIKASCLASQGLGREGECAHGYTVGFDVEDFRRIY